MLVPKMTREASENENLKGDGVILYQNFHHGFLPS
jgi:hypothetical protein